MRLHFWVKDENEEERTQASSLPPSLTLQVRKWRPRKDSGRPEVTELVVASRFSLPGIQSRGLFSIAGRHFSLALFPKLHLWWPSNLKTCFCLNTPGMYTTP